MAVAAGAAGAAAAGYYFYASKDAQRNRRIVAQWATDFKEDVVRQVREMEHIDRQAIIGIIDGVSRAYGKMRGMNRADLREAAEELKKNWQRLSTELERGKSRSRAQGARSTRSTQTRTRSGSSRGRSRRGTTSTASTRNESRGSSSQE